jgi:hypothetical protein
MEHGQLRWRGLTHGLAIHSDPVQRFQQSCGRFHLFIIQRHTAVGNHAFDFATRRDTSAREQLCDAFFTVLAF